MGRYQGSVSLVAETDSLEVEGRNGMVLEYSYLLVPGGWLVVVVVRRGRKGWRGRGREGMPPSFMHHRRAQYNAKPG